MRQEHDPYKRMTPPSTQNLKVCCLTFSFLLYVGLRLTLEYLTISPLKWESLFHIGLSLKWESLFHIGTIPLERKHFQTRVPHSQTTLTYTVINTLNGTRLPETSVRRTFNTRIKLYSSKSVTAINHQLWYHLLRNRWRKH